MKTLKQIIGISLFMLSIVILTAGISSPNLIAAGIGGWMMGGVIVFLIHT